MRSCANVPHVLLLVETSSGYGRGILEGIGRCLLEFCRSLDIAVPEQAAIAAKAGFPCFKHFARVFSREAGITPHAYRKAHRLGI